MTFTHKVEEPVELSSAQIIQMTGTQSAPAAHLVSSTELAPVPDVLLPKPKRRRRKATRTRTKKQVSPASAASASDAMDAQPEEDGAAVLQTASAPVDDDAQMRLVAAICARDPQAQAELPSKRRPWLRVPFLSGGSSDGPPPSTVIADDTGLFVRFMAPGLVAMAILGGTLGWFFW